MNEDSVASVLETFVRNMLMNVNTCFPGTIQSYENGKAAVVPSIIKIFDDGDTLPYPVIPDARVIWPSFSGGQAGMKGPVKAGDPCLVIISQQAIDGSLDPRMHDLQDAYALMCDLGNVRGGASNNTDLILYNGKSSIILKDNGEILINGNATVALTQSGQIAMNAPAGMTADVQGSSSGAVFKGPFNQSGGNMTSNGVVVHLHVHPGVQSGGSNTGTPV